MGLPAVVVMKNPNERLAFSVSVRRGEQRWAGHASAIAILTKAATPTLVDCRKVSRRGKWQFFRARFYHGSKFRLSLNLPLMESCWGVPSPNPALFRKTEAIRLTPIFDFQKTKEEPNDKNLQHTETKLHRKNPSG